METAHLTLLWWFIAKPNVPGKCPIELTKPKTWNEIQFKKILTADFADDIFRRTKALYGETKKKWNAVPYDIQKLLQQVDQRFQHERKEVIILPRVK